MKFCKIYTEIQENKVSIEQIKKRIETVKNDLGIETDTDMSLKNIIAQIELLKNDATPNIEEKREYNQDIGLVMMGYLNNIFIYGIDKFAKEVSGIIDAVICVDLPEDVIEESQLKEALKKENIALIKLVTPTTSDERIQKLVKDADGFIYSVNVAGITGVKSAQIDMVNSQISRIKKYTDLPVVSGFGIKTEEDVKVFSKSNADGIVIGSGIVEKIQEVSKNETNKNKIADFVKDFCSKLIINLNS